MDFQQQLERFRNHDDHFRPATPRQLAGGAAATLPPPPRSFLGWPGSFRLAAAGAILAGLAALTAAPPAIAAPNCTPVGKGTFPTATYTADSTVGIICDELTGGLTLTVEEGVKIGVKSNPVGKPGIYADGSEQQDSSGISYDTDDATDTDNAGADDITVTSSATIYGVTRGISVGRQGTGKTKVEHKAGTIFLTGAAARGINTWHYGASTASEGIEIVSSGDIDLSAATGGNWGIYAQTPIAAAGRTIPLTINVTGGTIKTRGRGTESRSVYAKQNANGDIRITTSGRIEADNVGITANHLLGTATGDITITATKDSVIEAGGGIEVLSVAKGGVTVKNSGRIVSDYGSKGDTTNVEGWGIKIEHRGDGKVMATHMAGGSIVVTSSRELNSGIHAIYKGIARADAAAYPRSIEVVSAGAIESKSRGITARAINNSGVDKKIPISVHVTGGTIDAGHYGIYAETRRYNSGSSGAHSEYAGGKITVTVDHGATVMSESDGIYVDGALLEGEMRAQTVTVRGKVMGGGEVMGGDKDDDGEKYAGVHMVKGGTVVIGPRAHVSAESGVAVKANAEGDMAIVLVKDGDGLVGTVDGEIRNGAETVFRIRNASGTETALTAGDAVKSDGGTKGVYRSVRTSVLTEAMEDGSKVYKFEMTGAEERQYHARARVYEALPSVLLDLNAPAPRMSRDASGGSDVWAALDAGEGERQASGSTTSGGMAGRALAWDFTHWGVASGFDFPAGEDLTVGVSAHHRRGKAAVKHGGTVKASGTGVGASVTHGSADAVYVRGWVSYSRFSGIELMSDDDIPGSGSLSKSDVSGSGLALGVEAGMRTELEGMTLTPRGGFVFSSVDIDGFSDLSGVAGSGRVSGSGRSFKGRLGVTAEIGEVAAGAAVYASLDAEHDFSAKRDVIASGTLLSSKPKATWGRLGLGGELSLSEDGGTMLSGEAYYATAGGGNSDFGGGLTLGFRF